MCNLMDLVSLNLQLVIEMLGSRHASPPQEFKRPQKHSGQSLQSTNEQITCLLKMICRVTDKRLQAIPTKQLLKMKSQGLNKQQFMQLALKPLF